MSETVEYEYEERAAIREIDGGIDEIEANQLALIDIQDRVGREQKTVVEPAAEAVSEDTIELPERGDIEEIQRLRDSRQRIAEQRQRESDEQKQQELFQKWVEINMQILDLRKGS